MLFNNRLAVLITTLLTVTKSFDIACAETQPLHEGSDQSLASWSQGNKHFTTTFYPHAQKAGFNFVFSPISLQVALSMASELAVGETQKEMIGVSCLPAEESVRLQAAQKVLSQFNTGMAIGVEPVTLMLANGAWLSSEMIFRQDVEKNLADFYQSEIHSADFIYSSEATRQTINTWVEENTQSKIQDFMPEGSIDQDTKLVLVNTLYMRAPWLSSFDPLMTYDDVFYGLEKSLRPISYMRKIHDFKVLHEVNYSVVELSFKKAISSDANLALFVVLPNENVLLKEIEKTLTTRRLAHWIEDANPQYVDLSLPKFKLSSSIPAKKILQEMGLQRPFSTRAEFDLEGQKSGLVISDIFHNATFEVDEWGGVGSAATGIGFTKTSFVKRPPPQRIHVNRPFLVVVADKDSGIILFAGRVMQPKVD